MHKNNSRRHYSDGRHHNSERYRPSGSDGGRPYERDRTSRNETRAIISAEKRAAYLKGRLDSIDPTTHSKDSTKTVAKPVVSSTNSSTKADIHNEKSDLSLYDQLRADVQRNIEEKEKKKGKEIILTCDMVEKLSPDDKQILLGLLTIMQTEADEENVAEIPPSS